jgi:hypothetical protein
MTTDRKTVSRRTVTAGMAWSVPAVAAVAAAPLAAASPNCPSTSVTGDAVKYAGNSDFGTKHAYGFPLEITNTTAETIRIAPGTAHVDFEKKGRADGTVLFFDGDPCAGGRQISLEDEMLILAPRESIQLWYVVNETGNSANEAGCITSTIKVELISGEWPEGEGCPSVRNETVCFDDTPPTC